MGQGRTKCRRGASHIDANSSHWVLGCRLHFGIKRQVRRRETKRKKKKTTFETNQAWMAFGLCDQNLVAFRRREGDTVAALAASHGAHPVGTFCIRKSRVKMTSRRMRHSQGKEEGRDGRKDDGDATIDRIVVMLNGEQGAQQNQVRTQRQRVHVLLLRRWIRRVVVIIKKLNAEVRHSNGEAKHGA